MAPNTVETLRLLVVSREPGILRLLWSFEESNSWRVETAASGWEAMEQVQSDTPPHLLLLDVPRGDSDSLHLLRWLRRLCPDLPVVMLCYPEDAARGEEATGFKADDVLVRPFSEEQLELLIRRHLGSPNEEGETTMLNENIELLGEDDIFLSVSPSMQKLHAQAELLAQTDVPVLLVGEPGSGKGSVARLIHKLSAYSECKFQRINCAEMPADLIEIELFGKKNGWSRGSSARTNADKVEVGERGTLLLDEITAMPPGLQWRLFQVLQNKRTGRSGADKVAAAEVRILAASSDRLDRALAEKRLREDLYGRLSQFTIQVPPLRHRKEEIKVLLQHSMHKLARYYGLPPRALTASALESCHNHSWPGNFRELEMFVKRYLVAGDEELVLSSLEANSSRSGAWAGHPLKIAEATPEEIEAGTSAATPKSLKSLIQSVRWETERNAIADALHKTGWNRKAAARLLGVSYRSILYKIEQYQMSAPESSMSSFPSARFNVPGDVKGNGKAS
jgi:DNA-binding NtrC family response regulator